jgi:hypothetical protein
VAVTQSGGVGTRFTPALPSASRANLRRAIWDRRYFLVQSDDEELEPAAFAFFASRFSFSVLLAAVFELFEPPLSLLAMSPPGKEASRYRPYHPHLP